MCCPVALPPVRERPEDIPVLMEAFVLRYFRRRGEDPPAISDAARQAFMRYHRPGNVRELENACERIAHTCTCGTVRVGCMAANILIRAGAQPSVPGEAQIKRSTLGDRIRSVQKGTSVDRSSPAS
jgi:transcriptional regulator with PAS, ATPase and Fis domain